MNVRQLTAYCGLTCDNCPIYLATREPDKAKQAQMRVEIAALITQHYGTPVRPEDVTDCDGCRAHTGRLFSGCSTCEIRRCAEAKGCLTCAHCEQYPCETLTTFFATEPGAKAMLDGIRKQL